MPVQCHLYAKAQAPTLSCPWVLPAAGQRGQRNVHRVHGLVSLRRNSRPSTRCLTQAVASTSAGPDTSSSAFAQPAGKAAGDRGFHFVCPICLTTEFTVAADGRSQGLHCGRCARTFESNATYADLTLLSGAAPRVYRQDSAAGKEIFRSPLVSFVYERGWRQGFAWAGFPGADKEYDLVMDFLQPAYNEVLVDMSCGSGLFSRRFAKSGRFAGVVASDFSENMLKQTAQFFRDDPTIDPSTFTLLRADVARLPFATGSVAAIHAGAAIHCWPDPTAALAEISRVLRPGGVFVASTFLKAAAPLGAILGDDAVRPLNQIESRLLGTSSYRWWEEEELKDISAAVGLQNFRRHRDNRFIMFCVSKPLPSRGQ